MRTTETAVTATVCRIVGIALTILGILLLVGTRVLFGAPTASVFSWCDILSGCLIGFGLCLFCEERDNK